MEEYRPATVRDLMTNPPGAGSAHVASRQAIIDGLRAKFGELMSDPATKRRFGARVFKRGADYTVWIKVPSSSLTVNYDVILLLRFPDGARATASAEVQLYCNSPSWVFVYGYVAATTKLLIPGWEKALGKAATKPPKVRNPGEEHGFDKIVFQAISWILGPGGLLTRNDLDASLSPLSDAPTPRDQGLFAAKKLADYDAAERKAVDARRRERAEARATAARDAEKQKKIDAGRTSKAARGVRAAGSVRAAGAVKARPSAGKRRA